MMQTSWIAHAMSMLVSFSFSSRAVRRLLSCVGDWKRMVTRRQYSACLQHCQAEGCATCLQRSHHREVILVKVTITLKTVMMLQVTQALKTCRKILKRLARRCVKLFAGRRASFVRQTITLNVSESALHASIQYTEDSGR